MINKTNVIRYAAIGMATLSMAGFAAASTVTLDTTGADSHNVVTLSNGSHVNMTNLNGVGVENLNGQGASTGSVSADMNTVAGGSISSGAASNSNAAQTGVVVTNTGMGAALASFAGAGAGVDPIVDITKTGAQSDNTVKINNDKTVNVTNVNEVQVVNSNSQSASSGSVRADKNTQIGGLTSGAASNTSTQMTNVQVGN